MIVLRATALGLLAGLGLVAGSACSRAESTERPVAPPMATPTPEVTKVLPPRPAQLTHVTIKAIGMYCEESCPLKVRHALADLSAVYELGFDLSTESIFVSYDATLGTAKQVTRPMIAAIKASGFDPWLAKESWPADATAQVVARSVN